MKNRLCQRRRAARALGSLAAAWLCAAGSAEAALDALELSPDITVALGAEVLGPEEVGNDNLAGGVAFTGVGVAIPIGVNIDAFDRLPGGVDALFSVDVPASIGGVFVGPADVARVSAGVVSIAWSGSALPAGSDVDAIARMPDGDLVLSFDTTVSVGGIVADDEDAVRIDQPGGAVSLPFDGSARGIASGIDLDGVDALVDGRLLLSFDVSGSVGGVDFSDEDALSFDPATNAFAMEYDGSLNHAAWLAGDLDAVDGSLDPDGDGIADASDLCPFWPQAGNLDTDLDKRGNECECTDQTGDGRNNVADIVAINVAIFNPGQITPLCDGNNDGLCNVGDIVAANIEIFSPSNTSICARQPFPGP
jgi:hypothetical protein